MAMLRILSMRESGPAVVGAEEGDRQYARVVASGQLAPSSDLRGRAAQQQTSFDKRAVRVSLFPETCAQISPWSLFHSAGRSKEISGPGNARVSRRGDDTASPSVPAPRRNKRAHTNSRARGHNTADRPLRY